MRLVQGPARYGRDVVVDHIDNQVLIILLRVQVQLIEEEISPHFFAGEQSIDRQQLKAAELSAIQAGHDCDRLHIIRIHDIPPCIVRARPGVS